MGTEREGQKMKSIRIYKRGEVWWLDYFARGKRVRQSTKCGDRKAAQRFADAIATASRVPTFAQAVEVLRMIYGEQPEGQTQLEETWNIYSRVAEAVGKSAIAAATLKRRHDGPVAAAFAEHLAKEGLKTKTRANIIGELGTIWNLVEKGSRSVRNPWGSLCPRITDARRGEAFSREQEAAVLEAAKKVGKGWYEVSQIMRLTGLRYGDVARLTWAEVGEKTLRIKPHKTAAHGIEVVLPIIPELRAVLDAIPRTTGDYLFPVHSELYGNRGRQARSALNFREVLDAAGLGDAGFTVHSWRHTAATRLAEAGADIETRKRILGHTEDATARRYDHDEHLAEVAAALKSAAK